MFLIYTYVRTSIPVCLLEIDNPSLSHIKLKDISLNSSVNSFRIQLPFVAIILPLHESTWRSVSFEGSSSVLLLSPLLLSSFYPSSGVSVTFCRIIEFLFLFCAGVFHATKLQPAEEPACSVWVMASSKAAPGQFRLPAIVCWIVAFPRYNDVLRRASWCHTMISL